MDNYEILIPEFKIERKIREIAQNISIKHSNENPPVMICVLNGGFMFFTELVKEMSVDILTDFVRVKSYDMDNKFVETKIIKDIELDITNKEVYIVDDILESGNTINNLIIHLQKKNPAKINVVTLLKRKASDLHLDHFGFEIDSTDWVYGFGLDDGGLRRNYRNIYVFKSSANPI